MNGIKKSTQRRLTLLYVAVTLFTTLFYPLDPVINALAKEEKEEAVEAVQEKAKNDKGEKAESKTEKKSEGNILPKAASTEKKEEAKTNKVKEKEEKVEIKEKDEVKKVKVVTEAVTEVAEDEEASVENENAEVNTTEEVVKENNKKEGEDTKEEEDVEEVPVSYTESNDNEKENKVDENKDGKKEVKVEALWKLSNYGNTAKNLTPVVVGKAYQSPFESKVSLTFTSLPEGVEAYLSIERISLTEEQMASLGTSSEVAFDIVLKDENGEKLEDGTFEFDLTLPFEGENGDFQVKFAETVEELSEAEEVTETKTVEDGMVKINDLNHLTVFVVVSPNPAGDGNESNDSDCATATIGGSHVCYDTIQEAVDAASDGDTINVVAGTYTEGVVINKSNLTIRGANTGTPANSSRTAESIIDGYLKVNGDNIEINGFRFLDGDNVPAGELTSIHIVGGNQNITISNSIFERTGTLDFDSSRGIINEFGGITNLTIENNYFTGWHTGVYLQNATNTTINNNEFDTSQVGISIDGPVSVTVSNNVFTGNAFEAIGVGPGTSLGSLDISNNNFSSNAKAIENYTNYTSTGFVVDAQSNDWGDPTGPNDPTSSDGSTPDTNAGSGDQVNGAVNYGNWLGQVKYIQGRTFLDEGDNGLLLSADGDYPSGMEDGFTVRLYNSTGNNLEEQTTSTTGNVGQYAFENLDANGDVYYICGVDRSGYNHSSMAVGINLVDTNNLPPDPSTYSAGEAVSSSSFTSDTDISEVCWKVTLNGMDAAYVGIGFVEDTTPPAVPTGIHIMQDGNDLGCGGYVKERYITIDWNDNLEADLDHYDYQNREATTIAQPTVSEFSGNIRDEDGDYQYRVRAVDNAGNASDWTDWCGVTLDRVKPLITWDAPADGSIHNGPVTLQAHADETLKNLRFKWMLEGEDWNSGQNIGEEKIDYEYIFDPAVDGVYTLRAQGRDLALNWNSADPDIQIIIDRTPPQVEITSPADGEYVNGVFTTTMNASDEVGMGSYYIRFWQDAAYVSNGGIMLDQCLSAPGGTNLGTSITETCDFDTTGLTDGTYFITAQVLDAGVNWGSDIIEVKVDNTAPAMPTGLQRRSVDGTQTFDCGDYSPLATLYPDWDDNTESDFSHYEYSSFHPDGSLGIEKRVFNVSEFVHNWVPTEEGTYGYAVRAVDLAGNKSDWSLSGESLEGSCKITYDSTAPSIPEDLTFLLGEEDLGCGAYTNSYDITTAWGESEDNFGVAYYEYQSYNPPTGWIWPSNGSVQVTGTERDGKFTVGEGVYGFRVRAVDEAGNKSDWVTEAFEESCQITYDITAPTVNELENRTYVEGQSLDTIDDAEVTITATDNELVNEICYEMTFTGKTTSPAMPSNPYSACVAGNEINGKSILTGMGINEIDTSIVYEGEYAVRYWANDEAGNTSEEGNVTYTITNVAPEIITFTVNDNTITEGDTVSFNGIFTDPSYIATGNYAGEADDSEWIVTVRYGNGSTSFNVSQLGTLSIPNRTYNSPGTYTVTLEVCEDSEVPGEGECTTATRTITVSAVPTPTGGGAGDAGGGVVVVAAGVGAEGEILGEEVEPVSYPESYPVEGEVLGALTCEQSYRAFGYVYYDANENNVKDDDENIASDVRVKIYTEIEGEETLVKIVRTDSNGMWEEELCPGDYTLKVDLDTLPQGAVLSEEEQEITVTDSDVNGDFSFRLSEPEGGFPWWIILVCLLLLVAMAVAYFLYSRKQEEKNNKVSVY